MGNKHKLPNHPPRAWIKIANCVCTIAKKNLLGTARYNNSSATEMRVLSKDTTAGTVVCGAAMCNFDEGCPHSAEWFEVEALMPDSCKAHGNYQR